MPRTLQFRASDLASLTKHTDACDRPAFSFGNRIRRLVWNFVWLLLYRLSPRSFHAWRAPLLRLFDVQLGPDAGNPAIPVKTRKQPELKQESR